MTEIKALVRRRRKLGSLEMKTVARVLFCSQARLVVAGFCFDASLLQMFATLVVVPLRSVVLQSTAY